MAGFRVTGLLHDKVSLMTGTGNSICRGFALRFAAEGDSVGILDTMLVGLIHQVRRMSEKGGK